MFAVVLVVSGIADRGYSAENGSDPSEQKSVSPAQPDKPGGLTPEQKRTYAHLLAKWWLPILLLLIIFVVLLMVVTRAMKLWVLDRKQEVKFDAVDDVWSQASDKHKDEKKT